MADKRSSRDLGEATRIARRDFLQGTLVGAAMSLTGPWLPADAKSVSPAAQDLPGYYPPTLTGMRGSHPGSFENAHALRDGRQLSPAVDTGERFDLIVVGAGISGLSAAYFFRARTARNARILILDNHDDFGGHAKRNEFHIEGNTQLANGGTWSIESPRPYSPKASALIRELGIDVEALSKQVEHPHFYERMGLQHGVFFDAETFGLDRLVKGGAPGAEVARFAMGAPFSEQARKDFVRLNSAQVDYWPGLSSNEKKERLAKMSYRDFLQTVVKVDPSLLTYYQRLSHPMYAVGIDAVSALDCWVLEFPGFQGMKLEPGVTIANMGPTAAGYCATGGSKTLHFPDGNATIARLLVRALVPQVAPGNSARDIVMARMDYGKLDRPDSPTKVRLSSTAVNVRNVGGSRGEVEVTYIRDGKALSVRGAACVLAGYNMMIPYLCPDLPAEQKEALHACVKAPLVYTTVALRNWHAFHNLGIDSIYAPGSYHSEIRLNPKVDIGSYRSPQSPDKPILIQMVRTPTQPGLAEHEQNKAGRAELLATPFATFERNIRDQLDRMLRPGGFEVARDIVGITVNRWPHGYSPEFNPLFESEPATDLRLERARKPFGRISIANADSGGYAYTDSAIDQAHRAVTEILGS